MHHATTPRTIGLISLIALLVGCAGRPALLPNSDPALRRTAAQFAADAAKRHPFPADAPKGEATARAEVDYTLNLVRVVNLSDQPWTDAEVWVNRQYVVSVPQLPPHDLKTLNFQMLFDDQGNYFPLKNNKVRVETLQVYADGKLYDVPVKIAY